LSSEEGENRKRRRKKERTKTMNMPEGKTDCVYRMVSEESRSGRRLIAAGKTVSITKKTEEKEKKEGEGKEWRRVASSPRKKGEVKPTSD